ncbi:MAG: glycosyltransferase [Butyrivibrio sp.]|nr:glycosyltransferase [Butyrivibrio sp.]
MKKISVVHIIPGLGRGGAETMLYQLIKYRKNADLKHTVISLGLSSYYEDLLRKEGGEVLVYDLKRHPIRTFWRIRHMLDEKDVLCCWMYLGNLIGYFVGYKRVAKIIWNIRHADLDRRLNSKLTIVTSFLCAHFSKRIDIITYNGNRSKTNHEAAGYSNKRSRVIRNGCDTSFYNYDDNTRETVRHELGIRDGQQVVLSVTRNHRIKDLPNFIQAFVYIHHSCPESVAVMCGQGVDSNDAELIGLCDRLGLEVGKDILFLGFRDDVKSLFCAADEYILHSAGEAFPNTLIQAMACGVPCVATDVGDAREMIGDDRYIVPVSDPKALAEKCVELLRLDEASRESLRKRNRRIVEEKYDINEVIKKYEDTLISTGWDN